MIALTIDGNKQIVEQCDLDEAMRRFWEAKQAGDGTAELRPATEEEQRCARRTPSGQVSRVAADRIQMQDEALVKAGFALPPPIYAPGTVVEPVGQRNFRLERRRVAELPSFEEAAAQITRTVGSENREDVITGLEDLRMDSGGTLHSPHGSFRFESGAFSQFAVLSGFGSGSRYLRSQCDSDLRSVNVNRQLEGKDRRVVLRVRGSEHQRRVFATVSPTYAAVDVDRVLSAVMPQLADARAEVYYDGTSISATALFMPDEVVDFAAGDVFKVGVRIDANDVGTGRIRVSGVAFRNLCLNMVLIGEGRKTTMSAVHRGDPERILAKLEQAVDEARRSVGYFLDAWGHARTLRVERPDATFRSWLREKRLELPGVRTAEDRDVAVEELLVCYDKEPGGSLADVVNAITRLAHEKRSFGARDREAVERQAAGLVLVPR